VGSRDGDVFFRALAKRNQFLGGEIANNLRRRTDHQRAGRDFRALSHEGAGADQAFLTDLRPVKNHSSHADEAQIADRAGVDDCGMTDRAIRTDHRRKVVSQVNNRPVLHIRPVPDMDRFDIAPQDSPVENTRVPAQSHIADKGRIRGDKGGERSLRLASEEFVEAFVDRHERGRDSWWKACYFLRFASAINWASASIQSEEGSPGQPMFCRRSPI